MTSKRPTTGLADDQKSCNNAQNPNNAAENDNKCFKCYRCKRDLPRSEFAHDTGKARGFASICLTCDREKSRLWYERNRDAKLAAAAAKKRPVRKCARCGGRASSQRHRYCDACRELVDAEHRPRRGRQPTTKTSERGYGTAHQKLRKLWEPKVAAGGVRCARCGHPIMPGAPWDLGHRDEDRSRYTGPEHRRCNRQTSTHRVQRAQTGRSSRTW